MVTVSEPVVTGRSRLMLVLSRQRDETIMIGDEIELTIVDIRGDKVRIGIKAPANVAVHRKEVYEAIRRENEQAAAMPGLEFSSLARPDTAGAVCKDGLSAGNRIPREGIA